MASSVVSHKCVANRDCKKNGIVKCDGCSSRFCSDHFSIHRRELEARLEVLCSDRDLYHHELKQTSQDPTEYLYEIDLWEQQTLAHVKETAHNARHQVRELAATKNTNKELDHFSEELRRRKESEDYFEHDIERLGEQLEQIKIESEKASKIDISFIQIDWTKIIKIICKQQKQLPSHLFHNTSLLNLEQEHILNEFCGKRNQQWQLIYRGTRDGFGEGDFLRYSADQGPTVTLILGNDYLFGGYTKVSWKNTENTVWNNDPSAFLFTLTNPHQIPPTKYPVKLSGERATRSHPEYGPTFGKYDICIHPNSDKTTNSNSGFPKNYCDTTGMKEKTFTETKSFETSEIEVYKQV